MTLQVAFYGDDFTGSSDNLAQFHHHGLRAMLFFDATDRDALRRHSEQLDILGVAGISRSLPPRQMVQELRPCFSALAELRPRFVQYKICSTFDSGIECGNFGTVIDEARRHWPGCVVPVYAAVPQFGRYTVFGNHFADHRGTVSRLDRHPSMSQHPVTPMGESDLMAHLASFGHDDVRLLDVLALGMGRKAAQRRLDELLVAGDDLFVLDTLTPEHLILGSTLLWELSGRRPVFALAAQGLAHGLGQLLGREQGIGKGLAGVEKLLVLSGSCAPRTASQIAVAAAAGFTVLQFNVPQLLRFGGESRVVGLLVEAATQAFKNADGVIIHTALGPDDPSIAESKDAGLPGEEVVRRIGHAFAGIFHALIDNGSVRRAVFAGGDTSSHAMRACGAYALSIVASDFQENAHLCRLHSHTPAMDGAEVLLKGGQVGSDEFLLKARSGSAYV